MFAIPTFRFLLPISALAFLAIATPVSAQSFDIRTDRTSASNTYMDRFGARASAALTDFAARRAAGLRRLQSGFSVDVIDNPELRTTEVVSARTGARFLTEPTTDRAAALRGFLANYADAFGVSADGLGDLVPISDYANPAGNMAWTEFEQRINGLPVFRGSVRGGFTARGELARTTGTIAPGLNRSSLTVLPSIAAANAISRAAQSVGWNVQADQLAEKSTDAGRITFERGPMADDAKAWLVYFPLAPGVARLAWSTEIWGDPDAFTVIVDAQDGTVLFRKNLTESESIVAPTLDFATQRAYLKTAVPGGVEVATPAIGQTVFFYVDFQVFGTGSPVSMNARAMLDGSLFCTVSSTFAPGQTTSDACSSGWTVTAGTHTLQWDLDFANAITETNETNNSATKTFTSSASTFDVVAQRAYLRTMTGLNGIDVLDQPSVGNTVYPYVTFQVTGTGSALSLAVRAVLDGTVFCSFTLQPTPGETWNAWCNDGIVMAAGNHTLQWDLDYTGGLAEQDETNNSIAKTFSPSSSQGTQPVTYVVYNGDSPAPLSPTNVLPGTGTQAGFVSRTTQTLVGNEAPNTFNNLGWMKDGATVTDGNNVEAGPDRDFVDGVDAPVAGVNRVFDFTYNPQTDTPTTAAYQNGEVTDMFYWTNVYHDRLYLLGFTEAAGNFQNDNFGRGGVAGDRIRAEAQDYSGLNNANFSTPSDGSRPRMQMYIFSGPNPARTSGIDHDVLLHELTHGTSNRLHNNANGLSSTMARGMGEGWSDLYARALLSTAGEDPNGIYAAAPWVTNLLAAGFTDNYYYGIRRFPYAVFTNVGGNGKPHNPLTFADIDSAQIDTSDGAYPSSPIIANNAFEVHNIGEIWCMALLEARARFITRLGFATGNQRFLQFVTDGMKLDPVNPTLLQGRDSIISAANAGGGTIEDIKDIWDGFAVRGMGYSSQVIDANAGSVIEAFDVPSTTSATSALISESVPNGWLDPGETVTLSLCVSNTTSTATGNVTGTLLASGGVAAPSGAQSYGVIPAMSTVCRNFSFSVASSCGGMVTATLQAVEGSASRNLTYSLTVGGAVPILTEGFDGVSAPALPAGWTTNLLTGSTNPWVTSAINPQTSPNRAFDNDATTISDNALTSPMVAMPSSISRLTFRNWYDLESGFDGGVLEIAIGSGGFQDILAAGGTFLTRGYNGTISSNANSPISNRQAWTGQSNGYLTTTVAMPASAASQNIKLRWRLATDDSIGTTGWSIDSVSLYGLQCAIPAKRVRGQITSN